MTFSQSVSYCFQNYANFQGRARRSELWWFYLFALIVSLLVQAPVAAIFGQNTLYWIVSLILTIVLIHAATGRRRASSPRQGSKRLASVALFCSMRRSDSPNCFLCSTRKRWRQSVRSCTVLIDRFIPPHVTGISRTAAQLHPQAAADPWISRSLRPARKWSTA